LDLIRKDEVVGLFSAPVSGTSIEAGHFILSDQAHLCPTRRRSGQYAHHPHDEP